MIQAICSREFYQELSTTSKVALVALSVTAIAALVLTALGGAGVLGAIGTPGFIGSLAAGGAVVLSSIGALIGVILKNSRVVEVRDPVENGPDGPPVDQQAMQAPADREDLLPSTFSGNPNAPGASVVQEHLLLNDLGPRFEPNLDTDMGKIGSYLFCGSPLPDDLNTSAVARNVLLNSDPDYLQEFQNLIREVILTEHSSPEVRNLFVYQTLAMLPFAYPEEGFEITIPIDGVRHAYTIDKKFELTPSWFSSPLPAYGLVSDNGPPMLVFMGTTYPAGQGFIASVLSDFSPGLEVGHLPLLMGRKELQEWLNDKEGVHVTGASLGGALSIQAAKEFSDHIAKVYAFVPPGVNPWNRFTPSEHMEINLCCHDGDIVSKLGYFPEGDNVNLYHISDNGNFVHGRVVMGGESVTILRGDVANENRQISRGILTALHTIFSPILFLLVLPFQLLYRLLEMLVNLIRCHGSEAEEPLTSLS